MSDDSRCVVREAGPADAADVARVQCETWHVAYGGLVADSLLATMNVGARTPAWERNLAESPFTTLVLVDAAAVVGFVTHGPSRDPGAGADQGEILALYVLQQQWRRGFGRRLLAASHGALRDAGFAESILWVLEGNLRAIDFYRAVGYRLDGARKAERRGDGAVLREERMRAALT